jgi:hypothetical protein
MVFKGQMPDGYQRWDNNDGNNWQVRWQSGCGAAPTQDCPGLLLIPPLSKWIWVNVASACCLLIQAYAVHVEQCCTMDRTHQHVQPPQQLLVLLQIFTLLSGCC